MNRENYYIKVSRNDFLLFLKQLKLQKGKLKNSEVIISFKNHRIYLSYGGMLLSAMAEGNWEGQAHIPASFLNSFNDKVLDADPVLIQIRDDKFWVQSGGVNFRWQSIKSKAITLPINAEFAEIISLPLRYSHDEIRDSGYLLLVQKEELRRDRIISQALKILKPACVTREALKTFIENILITQYGCNENKGQEQERNI